MRCSPHNFRWQEESEKWYITAVRREFDNCGYSGLQQLNHVILIDTIRKKIRYKRGIIGEK